MIEGLADGVLEVGGDVVLVPDIFELVFENEEEEDGEDGGADDEPKRVGGSHRA